MTDKQIVAELERIQEQLDRLATISDEFYDDIIHDVQSSISEIMSQLNRRQIG